MKESIRRAGALVCASESACAHNITFAPQNDVNDGIKICCNAVKDGILILYDNGRLFSFFIYQFIKHTCRKLQRQNPFVGVDII